MKHLGLWILVFGSLVVIVPSGQAQLIISADFSPGQGYKDGPLVGQPAGAGTVWLNGNDAEGNPTYAVLNQQLVITQEVDEAGNAFDRWALLPLPPQTGKFTVTFDWQYVGPTDGSVDVGFCISATENYAIDGNDAPTYSEQGVMCRMQSGDGTEVIDVRNGDWAGGGTYEASEDIFYTDGVKYYMRYEIDASQAVQTYDVYLRPEGKTEIKLADMFGFRRDCPNGLDTIALWMDGSFAGSKVIIDNIVIAGPAPVGDWQVYQ